MKVQINIVLATLLGFFIVLTPLSCSKDDDDDDDDGGSVTVSENSAEAAKPVSAIASSMANAGNSANLTGDQRAFIRNQWQWYKNSQVQFLQGDSDTSYCAFFEGDAFCELLGDSDPTGDEEGLDCEFTCPGTGLNVACDFEELTTTCDEVAYTISGSGNNLITCEEVSDTVYEITATQTSQFDISGGSFTNSTLACNFSWVTQYDAENPSESEEDAVADLCANMSCTIDGAAISCEDMQTAFGSDSCD